MDEIQESSETVQETQETQTPEVGFPLAQPKPKAKSGKMVLIVLVLVILIGGAIFLFSRGAKEEQTEISPTPTVEGVTSTPGSTSPTTTPTTIDKSKVTIEVQNGTGITGEAAYLQGQLRDLGYTTISVGNAESQNQTITSITFSKNLSSQIVSEITKKMQEIYDKVDTKTSSTQKSDVVITTGLRKGVTPKPTATPTPTSTSTPTPTTTP